MAITFALVYASPRHLRYLATNSGSPLGGTQSIPNDGGATPDLLTDINTQASGSLQKIITARTNGIGTVVAGALTQAQARAIMNADATVNVGNALVPRAVTTVSPRSGTATWVIDINVDGQGDPVVAVTSSAAAGDAYVDIQALHSIRD